MANLYVRSSDGSDSDNGSSWALAKATLAGAAAIDAAGDAVYVSSAHAEVAASTVTLAFAGVSASPVKLWSVTDGAEPPTALAPGAKLSTTGAAGLTISGAVDARGMTFEVGNSSSTANLTLGGGGVHQRYSHCAFVIGSTSASQTFYATANAVTADCCVWDDVTVKFGSTFHAVRLGGGRFTWRGGKVDGAGATPNVYGLVAALNRPVGGAVVSGVDLSECQASLNLVYASYPIHAQIIGCRLPVGWSGSLLPSLTVGARVEMFACDDGSNVLRDQVADWTGSLFTETLIKPAGVEKSWRLAKASNPLPFEALPIKFPLAAGTHTVEIDVLTDGVTLTDADCWLEVQYAGSAASTLYSTSSDASSNPLSPAAQASSSTEWATAGLSAPVAQRLGVTVTVGQGCVAIATVHLARASTIVYVSPVPAVS